MSGPLPALLLAPFEATSSFIRGSALGPEAVAAELARIDTFDPEVGAGLDALGPLEQSRLPERWVGLREAIDALRAEAGRLLDSGRFPLTLGGEHTVTLGPLAAALERHGPLGLVQLDAHADLRDSYEGLALSHGCVVRRAVSDLRVPALGIGIRSLCRPEAEFLASSGAVQRLGPRSWRDPEALAGALRLLPERVYLTVDMDVFDPSVAPGVGTPEMGGLDWPAVADIVDAVAAAKQVVAADLVELAPPVEQPRTVRLAARVAIRVLLRSLGSSRLPDRPSGGAPRRPAARP